MVHSLLLWLAHAESRRYTVNMDDPSVQPSMLQEHGNTLKVSQRNTVQALMPSLASVVTGVLSFCSAPPGGRIWQRSCRAGRSR